MENNGQKKGTYVVAIVIALLLTGLIFTSLSISKGRNKLNAERQTSEKLLSEKLFVEKELAKLQGDFSALKQMNDANQKLLYETNMKIAEQEKRISSMSGDSRSLKASRKELEDLKKLKAELEKEAAGYKSDYDKLMARNKNLETSMAAMEAEKNSLALQLEKALASRTDNYLATATRGKKTQKIVISAARTKKLNLAFELPQNLTGTVQFRIITPKGTVINPDDKDLSWVVPSGNRDLTASLSGATGEFEPSRQVILNYASKTKLAKGEYKIQILSNGNNIGNCRIMLR